MTDNTRRIRQVPAINVPGAASPTVATAFVAYAFAFAQLAATRDDVLREEWAIEAHAHRRVLEDAGWRPRFDGKRWLLEVAAFSGPKQPVPRVDDPKSWFRVRPVGSRFDVLRLGGRHVASGLTYQQVTAFFDVLRQGDSEEVALAEVRELGAVG